MPFSLFSYTYIIFWLYLFSNKPISRFVRHRGTQTESGISNRDVPLCLLLHFPVINSIFIFLRLKNADRTVFFKRKNINISHKNKGKNQIYICTLLSAEKY